MWEVDKGRLSTSQFDPTLEAGKYEASPWYHPPNVSDGDIDAIRATAWREGTESRDAKNIRILNTQNDSVLKPTMNNVPDVAYVKESATALTAAIAGSAVGAVERYFWECTKGALSSSASSADSDMMSILVNLSLIHI